MRGTDALSEMLRRQPGQFPGLLSGLTEFSASDRVRRTRLAQDDDSDDRADQQASASCPCRSTRVAQLLEQDPPHLGDGGRMPERPVVRGDDQFGFRGGEVGARVGDAGLLVRAPI